MREAIRDLRRLLAGEEVAFGPTSTRLRNRSAPPTPVYLLAAGPRMIELAGEVADGAFLMVGLHPAGVGAARRHLEAGAQRAGRSLDGFPVTYVVTLGLGPDDEIGARWVRAGSRRASPSSPTPAPPITVGCAPPASRPRAIRQASPNTAPSRLPMRLDCSALPNAAPSDCCARGTRPESRMFPVSRARPGRRLHHAGGGAAGFRACHAAKARKLGARQHPQPTASAGISLPALPGMGMAVVLIRSKSSSRQAATIFLAWLSWSVVSFGSIAALTWELLYSGFRAPKAKPEIADRTRSS